MLWYDYLAHFIAGAFLTNGVPHFAQEFAATNFKCPSRIRAALASDRRWST